MQGHVHLKGNKRKSIRYLNYYIKNKYEYIVDVIFYKFVDTIITLRSLKRIYRSSDKNYCMFSMQF